MRSPSLDNKKDPGSRAQVCIDPAAAITGNTTATQQTFDEQLAFVGRFSFVPYKRDNALLHLGVNLLTLWNLGSIAEQVFGRARYLGIFFVSGLVASAASYAWGDLLVPSVGASGASSRTRRSPCRSHRGAPRARR